MSLAFLMNEYLINRFLKNNIRKYHKYCMDWVNNITKDQIKYFVEEYKRLSL